MHWQTISRRLWMVRSLGQAIARLVANLRDHANCSLLRVEAGMDAATSSVESPVASIITNKMMMMEGR